MSARMLATNRFEDGWCSEQETVWDYFRGCGVMANILDCHSSVWGSSPPVSANYFTVIKVKFKIHSIYYC